MTREEASSVLGVRSDASEAEIKAAFRSLVKVVHADTTDGDGADWDRILEARDAMRDTAPGTELVPVNVALELVSKQERALERRERREERAKESEAVENSIVRRLTSPLMERQRKAWAWGVGAAGVALLVTLLRAVAVDGLGGPESGGVVAVISLLSIGAGVAGAIGWGYRVKAERVEHRIDDASIQLSNRGQFLQLLVEIEREGHRSPPWSYEELEETIDDWAMEVGVGNPGSLASVAFRVRTPDFTRLVVSKGLELGLLAEEVTQDPISLSISYVPVHNAL